MASSPPTVLITGANRGLGLEFVRQYAGDGWRVLACCRDPASATELKALTGGSGSRVIVQRLDLARVENIDMLAGDLAEEDIDVLINNAGTMGPLRQSLGDLDYSAWTDVVQVNVLSPLRMVEAFLPHLARSHQRKVVSISSALGSLSREKEDSRLYYRMSKAALNMVMKQIASQLAPMGVTVLLLHPGWVRTDMGGADAALDVGESIHGMRGVIAGAGINDAGRFLDYRGRTVPW